MKYTDRHSKSLYEKNLNKTNNDSSYDSNRKSKREKERRIKKFSEKVRSVADIIWWESLTIEQKESIMWDWNNPLTWDSWSSSSKYVMKDPQKRQDDFKSWILQKATQVKPEKEVYRENKINNILNEGKSKY